jgi:molybdate transport system substrate-binding protein
MRAIRLVPGLLLAVAGVWSAGAGAAELNVLSVDVMRPALQELAPAFEKESGHKLKIDYASAADMEKKINDVEEYDVVIVDKERTEKLRKAAKVVGGMLKTLAKNSTETYVASAPMLTEQPIAAKALVDFLGGSKAKEAYKAKGMEPG